MQLSKEHYKLAVLAIPLCIAAGFVSHWMFGIGGAKVASSVFDQLWGILTYVTMLRVWNNS